MSLGIGFFFQIFYLEFFSSILTHAQVLMSSLYPQYDNLESCMYLLLINKYFAYIFNFRKKKFLPNLYFRYFLTVCLNCILFHASYLLNYLVYPNLYIISFVYYLMYIILYILTVYY